MKLFKKLRKGFTLIELVVVIAVIAILAAVSVVSYVAITNRAKQSSDEQAVRQMNTILQANSVMDLKSINDVFAAFSENQLDVENYKPLYKDRYFFWDADANQIVYTDKDYVVIYPESLKGQSKGAHQWYSLTQQAFAKASIEDAKVTVPNVGQVEVKDIVTDSSGNKTYNYAVETPEQLFTIGQELKDAMLAATTKDKQVVTNEYKSYLAADGNIAYIVGEVNIELTQDLDFMGSPFNLCVKGKFNLKGNGHKIRGIVNNKDFITGSSKTLDNLSQPEHYGTGLVGAISKNGSVRGSATFTDVTFENCVFGFSKGKGAGLVGYAYDSDIEFNKVAIESCVFEAEEHSAGGFIADIQPGNTVTMKGSNSIKNSSFKLYMSGSNVSEANRECYGAGYFIGRETSSFTLDITAADYSFVQSGNSKKYGDKTTATVPNNATKRGYHYWDTPASRTLVLD